MAMEKPKTPGFMCRQSVEIIQRRTQNKKVNWFIRSKSRNSESPTSENYQTPSTFPAQ